MNSFEAAVLRRLYAWAQETKSTQLLSMADRLSMEDYQHACGYVRALDDLVAEAKNIENEIVNPPQDQKPRRHFE